jgi:phytoene/squalene synthetase
MAALPFALRRPALLVRDLLADRERPDLDALAAIQDPERFVWAILPHAARTFSACIAMLPARSARAAAVAYLYCRILDTYEDLSAGPDEAVASLTAFSARFETHASGVASGVASGAASGVGSAAAQRAPTSSGQGAGAAPPGELAHVPPPGDGLALDQRDRAHLLLVERCALVDRVFVTLPAPVQAIIADLVHEMAAGMAWAARTVHAQGGVLEDDEQLSRYCRAVLGEPVRFVARMTVLRRAGAPDLSADEHDTAMVSGEFIQLANVTRDVEKDLARGVTFRPGLRPLLGQDVPRPGAQRVLNEGSASDPGGAPARPGDGETAPALHMPADAEAVSSQESVRAARAELLDLAIARAPAYGRLVQLLDGGAFSLTRASALLMLLFTERYYGGCAERVGRARVGAKRSGVALLLSTALAVVSRGWSRRCVRGSLANLAAMGRPVRA